MKSITILRFILAIGLLPATLGAQSNTGNITQNEPVNYYAEFADLMHGEMDAKPAPVAAHSTNRFPAFVHYRAVLKGTPQGFFEYYEKIAIPSMPPTDAVFSFWKVGQGCPHDAMAVGSMAFKKLPVVDCSGR